MKYTDKDLSDLTKEAKLNMLNNANKEAQVKRDVEAIKAGQQPQNYPEPQMNTQSNQDLYSEFRDDNDGYEEDGTQAVNESYQQQINNTPSYEAYAQDYSIRANPTEEELQELHMIEEYEEPIFEGGPTQGQVLMWKKQWAGYDVLATDIADKTFIFRTLNRFEYKQIVALKDIDATRREEIICETVTLWPLNYNWRAMATEGAGYPSTLSKIVMQKSGFTQEYRVQVL